MKGCAARNSKMGYDIFEDLKLSNLGPKSKLKLVLKILQNLLKSID